MGTWSRTRSISKLCRDGSSTARTDSEVASTLYRVCLPWPFCWTNSLRKFRDFCSQGSSQLREQVGRIVKLTASKRPNTGLRVHFRPSPFRPATSDPSTIRVCGTQTTVTKAMAVHCLELYLVGSSTGCCGVLYANETERCKVTFEQE